jgi:hypothetical protein
MSADEVKCKKIVDDFMNSLVPGKRQKFLQKSKFIKKLKDSSLTEEEQDIVYNDYTTRALSTISNADIIANIEPEHIKQFAEQSMNTILSLKNRGKIHPKTTPAQLLDAISECANCGKYATVRCSRCDIARYCNKTCQKKNWEKHKKTCTCFV